MSITSFIPCCNERFPCSLTCLFPAASTSLNLHEGLDPSFSHCCIPSARGVLNRLSENICWLNPQVPHHLRLNLFLIFYLHQTSYWFSTLTTIRIPWGVLKNPDAQSTLWDETLVPVLVSFPGNRKAKLETTDLTSAWHVGDAWEGNEGMNEWFKGWGHFAPAYPSILFPWVLPFIMLSRHANRKTSPALSLLQAFTWYQLYQEHP